MKVIIIIFFLAFSSKVHGQIIDTITSAAGGAVETAVGNVVETVVEDITGAITGATGEIQEAVEGAVQEALGGWVPVPWAVASEDQEILDLLNLGLEFVIAEGIAEGSLENTEYELVEVNSLETQTVAGTNYDFDVIVDNAAGDTANLDFVVWDKLGNQPSEVTNFTVTDLNP